MRRLALVSLIIASISLSAIALDPITTNYNWDNCQGSARPYPAPTASTPVPDSLTVVMINHVGRHGARFPASSDHVNTLLAALKQAEATGTLTHTGMKLRDIAMKVRDLSAGQWGALDSLGVVEQQCIARRMYTAYPHLFRNGRVVARSSYVPRCVMSMYEFAHEIGKLDPKINIDASSGPQYNDLLRFFDHNTQIDKYLSGTEYQAVLTEETDRMVPLSALERAIGSAVTMLDSPDRVAMAEYQVLASLRAMGVDCEISDFLTPAEYNALWAAFNLKQYLTHSASSLSAAPAQAARTLLDDIRKTFSNYLANPETSPTVVLRFGHAETLMPLLALMRVPGCYYITDEFDTVARHWHDFNIVPMAANLQLILLRSDTDHYYVRAELNERPLSLSSVSNDIYMPLEQFMKR